MTISGTDFGNYTLLSVGTTTANITTKPLTGSFNVTSSKVYDGNTSTNITGYSLSGVIGSEDVSLQVALQL